MGLGLVLGLGLWLWLGLELELGLGLGCSPSVRSGIRHSCCELPPTRGADLAAVGEPIIWSVQP